MFSFSSKIRYSECDGSRKLSPEALLNYFQDCSTLQSEELGVGFDYLKPRKLVWVLASWQIVIHRYPKLGEEVVVGTFPYDFRGFLGLRNFLMKTKEGEVLAQANSLWTLLSTDTMKPTPPSAEILGKYTVEPKLDMEYAGRKIVIETDGERQEPFAVRKHHLDTNHHVNNGQYVSMAAEYLPEGVKISQIRAEYKKQAHLGDILFPYVVRTKDKCTVSLQEENGTVVANVEFQLVEEKEG